MKITNRKGLPEAIVRAVENDPYSKGECDYSISELLQPPRALFLKRKHYNEIEEDASERIWSLFGQAVHHIAERANKKDIAERRLYWIVSGKRISGGQDLLGTGLDHGTLTDYKVSTVSKFSFSDFTDWENQLNCYAQLLRWHKETVNKIEIVAFTRDHRPKEAEASEKNNRPYPEKAFKIELPIWPENKTIQFITERIRLHERAKMELPECTFEERWASPDTWAIKRKGQKNAVSGHSNYASYYSARTSLNLFKEQGEDNGLYIEHRPGVSRRCEKYCSSHPFCDQFKRIQELGTAPRS